AYGASVAGAARCAQKLLYIPADEYEFTVNYSDYGKLCGIATEFAAAPEGKFLDVVRARLVVEKKNASAFRERVRQAFLGANVYTVTGESYLEKPLENK
ncbi:MAG TPA: hypothetical protein DEB31_10035, partial [Clostridiales bacterium]|nr:hypothetical protein [Clostridiales bacterium]